MDGTIVLTGNGINMLQLLNCKTLLKLEMQGLRLKKKQTTFSFVKEKLGFKGTREQVLQQLENYIKEQEKLLKPEDIQKI
jgi:hypothetical protein